MSRDIHLTLFFTKDVSLHTWAENGSLEREVALYRRLQQMGVRVAFVTYGDARDLKYADRLRGIDILCNRWKLPRHLYEMLIPLLHMRVFRHTDVIKANQTRGADVALRTARLWHKPLVARLGYIWSDFARREQDEREILRAHRTERYVFEGAARVVVTTDAMSRYVSQNYEVDPSHIKIIPNYVLTDVFFPDFDAAIPDRICFVGRLVEQKNLLALIQACEGLPVELQMIGEGPLRPVLQKEADRLGVQLTLHGNILHERLPGFLRQASIFALVSTHEGHPKALLEAMSCGLAVLGADSPGIREQLVHGETGWVSGTQPEGIRTAIQHLLAQPQLRLKLGKNARAFVEQNYSLVHVAGMEYSLLDNLTSGRLE